MARRKRLTPAQPTYLSTVPVPALQILPRAGIGAPSPIAQVAGEASALAALREVSNALDAARSEGRLLLRLPLDAIEVDYLVRDRLVADAEELDHLMASIAEHGQRSPVEVAELAPGRYGLISGWRRLTALTRLSVEDEVRFGTVLAQVRHPDTAASAYVAMVEENEVRAGLSYYERARVAAKAVEAGVFPTEKVALQRLFSAASRARRSKIGSFLAIYRHLDSVLLFPAALPERLGLNLARLIEAEPAAARLLVAALAANPAGTAEEEQARLGSFVAKYARSGEGVSATPPFNNLQEHSGVSCEELPSILPEVKQPMGPSPETRELRPGLFLRVTGGWTSPTLELSGPALDPVLRDRLEIWLATGI